MGPRTDNALHWLAMATTRDVLLRVPNHDRHPCRHMHIPTRALAYGIEDCLHLVCRGLFLLFGACIMRGVDQTVEMLQIAPRSFAHDRTPIKPDGMDIICLCEVESASNTPNVV